MVILTKLAQRMTAKDFLTLNTLRVVIGRIGARAAGWGGLVAMMLLTGCASGLPDEKRYGYALPVQPAPDAWPAKPPLLAMPTIANAGSIFRFVDQPVGTGTQIEAIDANSGRRRWQTTLPIPVLVSPYNRNETSFVTDATLLSAGSQVLATYRFFAPPQHEPRGVRPANYYWEFAILDATTGRLLRHERLPAPASELSYLLVGRTWLLTDSKRHETSRLDVSTGERLWVHAGLFGVSVLTAQTIALYRHILGNRWSVAVLDINSGRAIFEQTFDALPLQTIRAVSYRDNVVYVEFGAQYEFNVELGARYQSYTVAFDANSKKALWRTAFSPVQ